ncbi:MAG: hypothetical protein K8R68_06770, partial [Bacteroidales bacterium]|nr:hypothetical protein [Bacteroidales bacterium]
MTKGIILLFLLTSLIPLVSSDSPILNKTIYVDDDGGEDYNLLIITPGNFSDELQPLVGHKKQYGIITKIV